MCGSIVDIQFQTAENRRGKKEDSRNHMQEENIMSASATYGGHNNHNSQVMGHGSRRSWSQMGPVIGQGSRNATRCQFWSVYVQSVTA